MTGCTNERKENQTAYRQIGINAMESGDYAGAVDAFNSALEMCIRDRGKTYATMLEIFANTGYTIVKKVLNAWDYGAPQKRERLITIGVRNDLVDKTEYAAVEGTNPEDLKLFINDYNLESDWDANNKVKSLV